MGNLICGKTHAEKVLDRSTPYHFPHTTQAAGSAMVYGQDHRYYNNIFVAYDGYEGTQPAGRGIDGCGTAMYNGSTVSLEEYMEKIASYGIGDLELHQKTEQPLYASGNVYLNGAEAFDRETGNFCDKNFDPKVKVVEDNGAVYLEIDLPEEALTLPTRLHSTQTLGTVRIADAVFENPDGSPLAIDVDLNGVKRAERPTVGPLEGLKAGFNRVKVWG